ncbi:hypothetical protein V6Z11_A10G247300 [Gossypium hirsutum]
MVTASPSTVAENFKKAIFFGFLTPLVQKLYLSLEMVASAPHFHDGITKRSSWAVVAEQLVADVGERRW